MLEQNSKFARQMFIHSHQPTPKGKKKKKKKKPTSTHAYPLLSKIRLFEVITVARDLLRWGVSYETNVLTLAL